MSKAEILAELPKLAPEERREIWDKLDAMDGYTDELYDDDADLSPEQRATVERRVAELEKDPTSGISWDEMQKRLSRRLGE